mmetsp:Transcript_2261/g.4952  ORF Transcript_2261/g.4952 Transcript_2261/m.4952 type:complete len:124 (+) Transcript_2261:304-675(+)
MRERTSSWRVTATRKAKKEYATTTATTITPHRIFPRRQHYSSIISPVTNKKVPCRNQIRNISSDANNQYNNNNNNNIMALSTSHPNNTTSSYWIAALVGAIAVVGLWTKQEKKSKKTNKETLV